jgi:GTP pyrophosphokinase
MSRGQDAYEDDEYYLATRYLDEFGEMLTKLIGTILKGQGINAHEITFRVKHRQSAAAKVKNNPAKYANFEALHDLLGVRIITYFSEQVDAVAKIIAEEFNIDQGNSVDKRSILDPDRFGYLSMHYVARLDPRRAALPENQTFVPLRFELQIRSILQHAWAEIEHDLGYKSRAAVPRQVRRRFSRLAGLLELADDEFLAIRDELSKYEEGISKEIRTSPGSVTVDRISIREFIMQDELVRRLDETIAQASQATLDPEGDMAKSYSNRLVSILSVLGVRDIREVTELLEQNKDVIIAFAERWPVDAGDGASYGVLPRGVSLYYLGYVLAFKADENNYLSWRRAMGLSDETLAMLRQTFEAIGH